MIADDSGFTVKANVHIEPDTEVVTTRQFEYGGEELDRGQVVRLKGFRNDDKLLGLGYFRLPTEDDGRKVCAECGAVFIADNLRTVHGSNRHG